MEPFVIFCKIIGFKGAFEITFNNISRECIVIHIYYLFSTFMIDFLLQTVLNNLFYAYLKNKIWFILSDLYNPKIV